MPALSRVVVLVLVPVSAARATNLLLVIIDDVGVDKVSSYADDLPGYRASAPHLPDTAMIDALAADGLRFSRAWAEPLCSPTRAAIHTGLIPSHSGIGYPLDINMAGLDPDAFDTLPRLLGDAGYATGLFGKWHLGAEGEHGTMTWDSPGFVYDLAHPVAFGYDRFEGFLGSQVTEYTAWTRVQSPLGGLGLSGVRIESTHQSVAVVDDALDWLGDQGGPWFAVVSFGAAHTATANYSNHGYGEEEPGCYRSSSLACLADESCDDDTLAVFQAQVECVDVQLERLLDGLDPDVLADTLIVVAGDNGTDARFTEGTTSGNRQGKGTTYESGVRVPLVIADGAALLGADGAGRITAPGREVTLGVHVMDLFPTLLEVAGVPVPAVDAQSFSDCFDVPSRRCGEGLRWGYSESWATGPDGAVETAAASVRAGSRYSLVVTRLRDDVGTEDMHDPCLQADLFDLARDPYQTRPSASPVFVREQLALHFRSIAPAWADGVPWCLTGRAE